MLRHFLDDFMSFVPLQMPQLLNVATMEEPQFYGDYVLLTFPLRDPYDLCLLYTSPSPRDRG